MSGGGAVYHDLGNLNYSFITKDEGNSLQDNFKKFTKPVIDALQKLGANANLMGKNESKLMGRKYPEQLNMQQADVCIRMERSCLILI